MEVVVVPVEFDYECLDLETRILVQQHTSEIRSIMRRTAYDAIEIGQKLIEIKLRLGHGRFIDWLGAEFDWSERTAQNYMRVADKFATVADLGEIAPSALYLLAASTTPETVRQEILDQAAAGNRVTKRDVENKLQEKATPAFEPGQHLEVQQGEYQGTTVKVLESDGIIVQCQTDSGEALSLLTTELLPGDAPTLKVQESKPGAASEIITQLEARLKIEQTRSGLLEQLLREAMLYVPIDIELHAEIAAVL